MSADPDVDKPATVVVINCAAAGGLGGTVHRAVEEDPRKTEDLLPLCLLGRPKSIRAAVQFDATERHLNCPSCTDIIVG